MIHDSELADLCLEFPAIGALPEALREEVRQNGLVLQAEAGQRLFEPGDPCDGFTAVLSGRLRILRRNGGGRALMLYDVGPGQVCVLSIACLLGDAPLPAGGVALSTLKAVRIPRETFIRLVEQGDFRSYLFRVAAVRQQEMVEMLTDAVFCTVERRLARLLLSREQPLLTTHQELAECLGTAREVVSRTLKEMEGRQLVRLQRGEINVVDRQGLAAIVDQM